MCMQIKSISCHHSSCESLANDKSIDIKPDNIFVNYTEKDLDNDVRFSEVQLGDLDGTCPIDSKWATSGTPLGAPMWRSPEMIMETPWGTPADIWSFGAMVSSSFQSHKGTTNLSCS